jgi:TonB family protein
MAGSVTDRPADNLPVPSFGVPPALGDEGARHWAAVAGGSVVAHLLIALLGFGISRLPAPPPVLLPEIELEAKPRNVTKLVAPPLDVLTQKTPNKGKVSQEFNLSSLQPRPAQPNVPATPGAAALPRRQFQLPDEKRPTQKPTLEAPAPPPVDTAQVRSNTPPPQLGPTNVPAPPPQIQPQEKPKLAFERPGTNMNASPLGVGRNPVQRPAQTIEEAARQVARGSGKGLIVGDEDAAPGASPLSPSVPLPGRLGSAVELLSDPQGVDFWPYLVKVLSTVKRNWFAVIPESARMGRQGRTTIQFAISRDGGVPKLVIATPSGADALDRAAVAAISASNPFMPLPGEFKGSQIRLQFVFKYNVK